MAAICSAIWVDNYVSSYEVLRLTTVFPLLTNMNLYSHSLTILMGVCYEYSTDSVQLVPKDSLPANKSVFGYVSWEI